MVAAQRVDPLFVALMPGLDDVQGHQYDYGRAVQAAVGLLGWPYQAAVPLRCQIDPLPSGWVRALDRGQYRFTGNVPRKLRSIGVLGASLARCLRQALAGGRPTIAFGEFFNYVQLTALVLGLATMPRTGLALWLLFRLPVHEGRLRVAYGLLIWLLRWQLGRENLRLLTDTATLVEPLQRLFGQTVTVVPIPPALQRADEPATAPTWPTPRPRYVAWWPGRAAEDKGLTRLRRLAAEPGAGAEGWGLVATVGAGLAGGPGGPTLRALPEGLPRDEYWGWMREADLIVMPYLAEYYHTRASGVFVEAIASGKPAAVSAGTWMAHEALVNDLPELIVDWDNPQVWERLTALVEDSALRPRLAAMAERYRQWHTPAGFAQAMQRIVAT